MRPRPTELQSLSTVMRPSAAMRPASDGYGQENRHAPTRAQVVAQFFGGFLEPNLTRIERLHERHVVRSDEDRLARCDECAQE